MFWFGGVKNPDAGNGIAVDPPKVFDDRSLILMADQLSAALSAMSGLDQGKVMQNIGLLQGATLKDVSRSVSIAGPTLPSTVLTEQYNTNANKLMPQSLITSNPAYTPAAPTLPSGALPALTQSGFGQESQDVLNEQMELSYKILNLRMLIERSITDRIHYDNGKAGQRAQAALGFQVSLDPHKQHKGCAAVVEIELTSADGAANSPALVSLMPQSKTYNTSALSREANAFGASAVIKVVTVGASVQETAQSYFLYRDTDTVAFERPFNASSKKLVFGWEFRPVLNREAVEPGLRQLFAVVALDAKDVANSEKDFTIKAKVKTYWVKFDKKAAVIKSGPREKREDPDQTITIPCSTNFHDGLGPEITDVAVNAAGSNNIIIDVSGNNFYDGTSVALGDKILNAATPGFVIKDSHLIQITASVADAIENLVVRGRYGSAASYDDAALPDPFFLAVQIPSKSSLQSVTLEARLYPLSGTNPPDLKKRLVILKIGTQFFITREEDWGKVFAKPDNGASYLRTYIPIDASVISGTLIAQAAIPLSPLRRSEITITYPVAVESLVQLVDGTNQTWAIIGRGFTGDFLNDYKATVIADKNYDAANGLKCQSDSILTFQIAEAAAKNVKNVVFTYTVTDGKTSRTESTILSPPKSGSATDAPAPKPKINPATASMGAASAVNFTGDNLDQITKVFFGTNALNFTLDVNEATKAKVLRVFLSRDVTSTKGNVSLALQTKDNSFVSADINIQ